MCGQKTPDGAAFGALSASLAAHSVLLRAADPATAAERRASRKAKRRPRKRPNGLTL